MGTQKAIDINHVANSKAVLIFVVMSRTFNGKTIATNLSTAIKTRLKMETIADSILKYTPTLQPIVASEPCSRLPLLVTISSVRYKGQVVRQEKKIGNSHVDIVVIGACFQTWSFADRDYYQNVSSKSCYADYGHESCKEDRNTEPTRLLISKTLESGVAHRTASSCQLLSKSDQVK